MGKIQNIKKLVSEGKGNQKMLEYALEYIESLERENAHLWDNYKLHNNTGRALQAISQANMEKVAREKKDLA